MRSKKKSKGRGKGKKAAKKFGGKEEGQQQGTLDAKMERLNIDEDSQTNAEEEALLEEAIKRAAVEKEALDAAAAEREEDQIVKSLITIHSNGCHHGYVKTEDDVIAFAKTFVAAFVRVQHRGNLGENIITATNAAVKEHPEVWYVPSKLKQVVSLIVFNGTEEVLEGELRRAQFLASMACYFEEFATLYSGEKDKPVGTTKFTELIKSDEHTLVKYLRKRIPCSCLDEKYKEVKSITKTGICSNSQCPLPDRFRVERSNMFSCARCGNANYCSRECQKIHWRRHKELCDEFVDWNTFDS